MLRTEMKHAPLQPLNPAEHRFNSHLASIFEDALYEPMTDLSLLIQHVRELAVDIAPQKLDGYLRQIQDKLNHQAIQFDTLLNTIQLKTGQIAPPTSVIRLQELLEEVAHSALDIPTRIRLDAMPPGITIRGHLPHLKYALSALLRMARPLAGMPVLLTCQGDLNEYHLIVADHPAMLGDDQHQPFTTIDMQTNLTAFSPVTRRRMVSLLYAEQVARLHGGAFAIKIWENQHMAARLIIPQSPS